MKKMLFIVASVLAMFMANAATVSWSAANVFGSDGTTKNSGVGYMISAGDAATLNALLAGDDAAAAASWLADNAVNSVTPATAGMYSSAKTDYASGSASFFAVIFDAATVAESSNYFVTSTVSATVPGSGNKVVAFGNLSAATSAAGANTAAGWATPEPTSGMLLLLGGALLALRRKQK